MRSETNFSLKAFNSFAVDAIAPTIYFPETIDHLKTLSRELDSGSYYLLGEGSNTLFYEAYTPCIVKPNFRGIEITETPDGFKVVVGSAENWHHLVISLIDKNILGLENLALIPGTVGAAPVQNIGAYGKELADYCQSVEWVSLTTGEKKVLSNEQCQFSYRHSVFKTPEFKQGVITRVSFFFPKAWHARTNYGDLKSLSPASSAKAILEKVIEVRNSKLPDPACLPNAGSFFKNPIVDVSVVKELRAIYSNLPTFEVDEKRVKLAAGWLIEHAGLKGFVRGNVGVHKNQALVLVNHNNGRGDEIISLAKHIQQTVVNKFGIKLEPEVRLIGAQGEQLIDDIELTQTC